MWKTLDEKTLKSKKVVELREIRENFRTAGVRENEKS